MFLRDSLLGDFVYIFCCVKYVLHREVRFTRKTYYAALSSDYFVREVEKMTEDDLLNELQIKVAKLEERTDFVMKILLLVIASVVAVLAKIIIG